MTESDFDWQPLGMAWWLDAARQFGASDRQTRFAAAKFRNCSNTQAAREAGYQSAEPGQLRTTAHRLSKSNIVAKLLAFAAAESGGTGYDGNVSRDEAKGILSRLARQSDPNIKIRACEQLAKFDEADRQSRAANKDPDPENVARQILSCSPAFGPIVIADTFFNQEKQIWGMPLLKQLAPLLKRDHPSAWDRYRASLKSDRDRTDFDALANGVFLTVEQIVGVIEPTTITTNTEEI